MTRASGPCIVAGSLENADSPKIESVSHGPEARVTGKLLLVCVIGFLLAGMITAMCLVTCGASLALFLAGFFILTPLLPPLVLTQHTLKARLVVAGCVVDGIGLVWLFAIASPQISFVQWLLCYLVLIAYASLQRLRTDRE